MVLRDIHESLLHGGKTTVPEYGMMERFLDLGVKNQAVSSKSLLVRSDCSPRSHPKPANTTWSVTAGLMSLFFSWKCVSFRVFHHASLGEFKKQR